MVIIIIIVAVVDIFINIFFRFLTKTTEILNLTRMILFIMVSVIHRGRIVSSLDIVCTIFSIISRFINIMSNLLHTVAITNSIVILIIVKFKCFFNRRIRRILRANCLEYW